MNIKIPYNKPYFTGKETEYIRKVIDMGKISGNGFFTQKCQDFFEKKYEFKKCLLTSSCTDALEMSAILMDIKEGDEVIIPSFTFVSTANAFILRGARVIFADSEIDNPNIDVEKIVSLISPKTKAIVIVHYAGFSCKMEEIVKIVNDYKLFLVEDSAQAIDNYYIGKKGEKKALGSFGHFSTFSFHETKNIISGEGGMLVINDERYIERAEIIWEKGTNRAAFSRNEINKYNWIDIGSSYLPSEITAAFLFAQLENLNKIQQKRLQIWEYYYTNLFEWAQQNQIKLPQKIDYSTNNGHIFYLICKDKVQRDAIIMKLKQEGILAVFHYQVLHLSPYYLTKEKKRKLENSENFSDTLLRLPLYFDLSIEQVKEIINQLIMK